MHTKSKTKKYMKEKLEAVLKDLLDSVDNRQLDAFDAGVVSTIAIISKEFEVDLLKKEVENGI